eukprot:2243906-Pleurochrysis_carterae.AAC.9
MHLGAAHAASRVCAHARCRGAFARCRVCAVAGASAPPFAAGASVPDARPLSGAAAAATCPAAAADQSALAEGGEQALLRHHVTRLHGNLSNMHADAMVLPYPTPSAPFNSRENTGPLSLQFQLQAVERSL